MRTVTHGHLRRIGISSKISLPARVIRNDFTRRALPPNSTKYCCGTDTTTSTVRHLEYLCPCHEPSFTAGHQRTRHRAALGIYRDWTKVNMYFASTLWKMKDTTKKVELSRCDQSDGTYSQLIILHECKKRIRLKPEHGGVIIFTRDSVNTHCRRRRCMGNVLEQDAWEIYALYAVRSALSLVRDEH